MCGHPECGQRSPKCRLLLVLSPTLIRTDSVFKREVATLAGFGDIQLERLSNLLVQPDCVLFFKSNQYVPIAVENGNFAGLRITFRRQLRTLLSAPILLRTMTAQPWPRAWSKPEQAWLERQACSSLRGGATSVQGLEPSRSRRQVCSMLGRTPLGPGFVQARTCLQACSSLDGTTSALCFVQARTSFASAGGMIGPDWTKPSAFASTRLGRLLGQQRTKAGSTLCKQDTIGQVPPSPSSKTAEPCCQPAAGGVGAVVTFVGTREY